MARIVQLDAHLADLIAAGEVVERPASVVKELMENAIDAGASQITVEIQHGGMTLIRVTDNGSGIPAEEAETAFLRHATSKLRTARDLEAIGTLGFRGEALAAIAAVSRISLLTRSPEADFGVALTLEAGKVLDRQESGCPSGTTIVVRDLFFNTPARLKFMKRDAAEGAAVFSLVQRMALAHPEISVKFLRDNKQELLTPGDGKAASALYSVLGRDLALGFLEAKGSGDDVSVEGFVSMPACCRGTRGYQHFILNGRPIKSRLLMAAVEEAYQNQKMVGKFPGCVLYITTKLSAVDVNVHPAKTEVKFLSDKKIFDGVLYTVRSALGAQERHPEMKLPEVSIPTAPKAAVPSRGGQNLTSQQFRDSMGGAVLAHQPKAYAVRGWEAEPPKRQMPKEEPLPQLQIPLRQEEPKLPVEPMAKPEPEAPQETLAPEETILPVEEAQSPAFRIVGELLHTYIVVEQGEEIHLIDKHAAHERMHFDRMKARDYKPMAQLLLEPLVFTPPAQEAQALLEQLPLLESFGFLVEDFGGGALVVRQIPFDIAPGEAEGLLCELAAHRLAGRQKAPEDMRDHLLHTMACKAAIKGGQNTKPQELLPVVEAVMAGSVKYCPHGRPVAITLTRSQLERQFGRS